MLHRLGDMRILHVIPGLTAERGGPSTVLHALCRHQLAAGQEISVLSTDQGARSGETPMPLPTGIEHSVCRVVGPDRIAYAPKLPAVLAGLLRRVDLVHAHSIFTYPIHVTLREAQRRSVPVILRPCGLLHPYSLQRSRGVKRLYLRLWGQRTRKACRAWHYTSRREAVASWPADNSPGFVLPNGFDVPAPMAEEEARDLVGREWPALAGQPFVLFLGRLAPKKRLDLLLEAFLAAAPDDWRLAVVGPDEGRLWEDLRRRFQEEPRWSSVVRIGTVGGPRKTALLTAAGFFALPSEHENFGVAPLEALALGTPLLVSPHVDLVEEIAAGEEITAIPLEVRLWQETLARLLRAPEAPRRAAQAKAAMVREQFSWDRLNRSLMGYYEAVVAGNLPSGIEHPATAKSAGISRVPERLPA